MKFKLLLFMILAFASHGATAGPFGIDVGNFDPDAYGCLPSTDYKYNCKKVPLPHDKVSWVIVTYIPNYGVCQIEGEVSNLSYEGEIRTQLEMKYGASVAFQSTDRDYEEYLNYGGYFHDIAAGMTPRTGYRWKLEPPVEGITSLTLEPEGLPSPSYLSIFYRTKISDSCAMEMQKREANPL